MKRTYFSLKTEVHFTKNGGTFYQKWRYVLLKTEVRFFSIYYTFHKTLAIRQLQLMVVDDINACFYDENHPLDTN